MLLPQLLWVRCGNQAAACMPAGREGVMLAEAAVDRATAMAPGRCGSHPRGEAQGLDRAVSSLFQSADMQQSAWPEGSRTGMHSTRNRQQVGTPGAPNLSIAAASPYRRASFQPVPRQEQVASDRQGGRKVQAAGERKPAVPAAAGHRLQTSRKTPSHMPPWTRLDQAMRAADLLLQGGGFSVLVLDLGSLAPEHVLRIPAATWFRFRAMAEASGTACILLSQAACARSSAALVLRFKPLRMELAGGTVVASVRYEAELARQRFQAGVNEEPDSDRQPAPVRKPPQATWQASPYSDWIAAPALPMRVAAGEGGAASVKKQAEARAGVLAWKSPGAAVAQDKKP